MKEAKRRGIPVHRVIGTVGGSARLTMSELKEYAAIAAENRIETLVNPIPSRSWDNGRQYLTSEGYVSGMRIRGQDNLMLWLKEMDRCIEAGLRGFLICDEGVLSVVAALRADGVIPKDVKFKVSVFAGHATPAGAKLIESLGADSFNPLADLDLSMLAAIRSVTSLPMDIYMSIVDAMGGHQRYVEADEIARVCAPVYFKIEPGQSEGNLYNSWTNDATLNELITRKLTFAELCMEWCSRSPYHLVCNDYRDDLSIPVV